MDKLGDYNFLAVRAAAILTNGYVAGTVLGPSNTNIDVVSDQNQLNIYLDFTLGSLTDCQVKVEFSHDGVTYRQETFSSISGGTDTLSLGVHKMTASGNYRLSVPIKDNYVRISAIGTGTVTSSSLAISVAIGTV